LGGGAALSVSLGPLRGVQQGARVGGRRAVFDLRRRRVPERGPDQAHRVHHRSATRRGLYLRGAAAALAAAAFSTPNGSSSSSSSSSSRQEHTYTCYSGAGSTFCPVCHHVRGLSFYSITCERFLVCVFMFAARVRLEAEGLDDEGRLPRDLPAARPSGPDAPAAKVAPALRAAAQAA
jgi:hypothetical protein